MLFYKFYLIQKNINVIFASKLTNLPIFMISYSKICMTNFKLNLVKKNDVKLP